MTIFFSRIFTVFAPLTSLASLLIGFGVISSKGLATTFYEQPLPDNVAATEVILRGTVGASAVRWGERDEGGRSLFTYYDFEVSESLKGQVDARRIQVRVVGGEKDGVGVSVPGAPKLKRGEDLVLMLVPTQKDGAYDVRGLMLGKFNIKRRADGSEVLEGPGVNPTNRTGLLEAHDHDHEGQDHSDHDHGESEKNVEPIQPWTMERLRELIRTQANASEAKKPEVIASPAVTALQESGRADPAKSSALALQSQSGEAEALQEAQEPKKFGESLWVWVTGFLAVAVSAAWMFKRRG